MGRRTKEYVYGLNPCFEVLRAGRRRIFDAVLSTSSKSNRRLLKLATLLEERDIPVAWVDKGRVLDLSESRENQGVALHVGCYPYVPFETLLGAPRLLLLDNVEDPHNVGAMLRSAEIFGFSNVLLTLRGTPDIYPSVVKVSAGATEFLRIAKEHSANRYLQAAMEADYHVAALDGAGRTPLRTLAGQRLERLLLVVGGENKAVGQYILNQAHDIVRIDQRGKVNSLNASVAAAIAMYELAVSSDNC